METTVVEIEKSPTQHEKAVVTVLKGVQRP
jgi:hypothetical protein